VRSKNSGEAYSGEALILLSGGAPTMRTGLMVGRLALAVGNR
jgi:hypothetical protein